MIRGDAVGQALFVSAGELIRSRQIEADTHLGALLEDPPAGTDPAVLTQLRYMYDAGGWVLLESALADLPADLAAAVESQSIRRVPGLDETLEDAVAAVLPGLRAAIPRIPLGRALAI